MEISTQVDWMSITYHEVDALSSLLPFDFSIKSCKSPIPVYQNGYETFPYRAKILISDQERLGTHVILSGKVLNALYADNILAEQIFCNAMANKGKISRIDIALDIVDAPEFTVRRFEEQLPNSETKLIGHKYIGSDAGLETCYLGNMKSRSRRFRCYDKAVETGIDSFQWVRLEYEKRRGANNMAINMFQNKVSISSLIKSVIDFPKWKLYQDILNCEKANTFRGAAIDTEKDWFKTLAWLIGSASTALAKCTYEEYLEHLSDGKDDWDIENSVVLNTFASALSANLRDKFDK